MAKSGDSNRGAVYGGGGGGLAVNAANGYLKLLIVHTRYLVYIYHF